MGHLKRVHDPSSRQAHLISMTNRTGRSGLKPWITTDGKVQADSKRNRFFCVFRLLESPFQISAAKNDFKWCRR